MPLKLSSSGGGSVTLAAPSTVNNVTFTLPDLDGTAIYANSSGNVGIGVTPSAWQSTRTALQIGARGSISSVTGTTTFGNNFYNDGTNWVYIATATAGMYQASGNSHLWYIAPSGTAGTAITWTQAMTLDASGNLLVGTTSRIAGFNASIHAVNLGNAAIITNSGTGATAIFFNNTSTGGVGSIVTNSTTVSYNTTSDYRLKESVQPMTGALAKVAALKPCSYTWKADGSAGDGFIAHELAEVMPQCVTGEKDAVDESGNPIYQGIDTSFLVATLTAAIQELKAEVDALRAQVEAK